MPLAPPLRLLARALAGASLILTGARPARPGPDRGRRHLRDRQHRPGQDRHRLLDRERELPGLERGRRQHRHPLVQRLLRPPVARGRPGLHPVHLPGHPAVGDRLRQGLPDPDVHRQRDLDHDLLHHHRHRRHPDPAASPAPAATSACTAPPAAPSTGTPCGSSRSSAPGTTGPGCTGQSNTPNFGPNVYVFDPSHVQRRASRPRSTTSSTPRSSTSSAPSGTRCCSSRAPTAPRPTSASTPRSRASARTRTTSPSTAT